MNQTVNILKIWISPGHDFRGRHGQGRLDHGLSAPDRVACVAGQGIEGDRYFGHQENYKGQITFFAEEIARQLETALALKTFDRAVMRRNVLVEGIDLNTLIGRRFRIGNVIFCGSEECAPCYWMNEAVAPGAFEWLKGHGGLRCRIETSGTLAVGTSDFELLEPGAESPCPT